ncbi:MAG: DUF421 domain-containing protein [Ruminococcaceae bacterium]|nr:DUF421 domain-containing protein [Oscillospiraceae bacterium]
MTSIFFRTAIIFAVLSICMKVMGKREIGELEVGELVTTLLVSEICSIPIDDPDIPLMNAIIPVIFIVSCEIIISFIKNKSQALKKIIDGSATYLIKNGKINQKAFADNRISIEEFFAAIRQNGAGRISDIEYCILEANGKISVIKKDSAISHIVISDGEPVYDLIKKRGLDEKWLKKQLGNISEGDVFLMTLDDDGTVNIILKEEKQ